MVTTSPDHVARRLRLPRCRPTAVARRHVLLHSIALGALFLTPLSVVQGLRCTSPSYPAVYESGTRQKVSWQLDSGDLQAAEAYISAFMYCMDRAGPNGGMWREVGTLFQLQPIEYGPTVSFTVPPCGTNYGGGDGAVRLVSYRYDEWGMGSVEDLCRYQILAAAVNPNPLETTPSKPKPIVTTDVLEPIQPTLAPPVSTRIPDVTPDPVTTPIRTQTTSVVGSSSTLHFSSTISGSGVSPTNAPFPPLPPLPPLPPMPEGPTGVGPNDEKESQQRFIQSLVGGLSGVCVVLVIVALVLRKRRRSRHPHAPSAASSRADLHGPSSGGLRGRLRGKMDPNSRFHRMDDDDYNDDMREEEAGEHSGGASSDRHFNEGEKMIAIANFNNSQNKLSMKPTPPEDLEKTVLELKRQSNSVRIPVNLMDMDVDGSMQTPLTPSTYRVSLGPGPVLPPLQPPALAHVGSDVALNDSQKWSLLLTGRRPSYTSSRDDYSFMQQGYLDDFAEQEDDASLRHLAALRPGEMARRDSQMMLSSLNSSVNQEDSDMFLSGISRGRGRRGSRVSSVQDSMTDDVESVDTEDASSVVRRYWAAASAARAERVEERRREWAREHLEKRLAAQATEDSRDTNNNGSSDSVATARPAPPPPVAVRVPSKPEASLNLTSETISDNCPTVGANALSRTSTMLLREDWESTESKMADRGSRVGTLTTHWTADTSSSRRRSSATTGASLSTGSRGASSLISTDHVYHQRMMMHPLYPRQYRASLGERSLQQRQRLGRSASISSSFTLSSFGSSGGNTRLYSYTHGVGYHHQHPDDNPNDRPFLHPLEPLPPMAYYPSHYHHPEDPFQDSASAYAYTLDEDGVSSQAATHLSIVSSSVDSSAVLATDPFKTFDSNNLIED
ncbi:hypothetical protein BGZ73_001974 [Actinomortierella ambigua]|nr:hypothetical protein BGZ73_001974 [Actinomortierella ambigua]